MGRGKKDAETRREVNRVELCFGDEALPLKATTGGGSMAAGIYMLLILSAIPSSPAGGNYLDLSGDAFYFARDNPTLDEMLKDRWTIEMWIYIKEFPSMPSHHYPKRNLSFILVKPGNYAAYLYSAWYKTDLGLSIYEILRTLAFFLDEKTGFALGAGDNAAFNMPEEWLKKNPQGITTGRWFHFAFQQNRRVVTAYINGVKVWDRQVDPNIARCELEDFPTPLYIGHFPDVGKFDDLMLSFRSREKVEPFKGAIDEVRISNVARYGDGFVPPKRLDADGHTMALWHFDEPFDSLKYEDSSGHGNTLFSSKILEVEPKGKQTTTWGRIKGR